jgi:excinuclease UvrABC ATPase subunit
MLDTDNTIEVQGARVHNLKNIDVSIKKYQHTEISNYWLEKLTNF